MRYFVEMGDQARDFAFVRRGGELFCRTGEQEHRVDLSLVGDGGAFSMIVGGLSYDVLADVERDKVTVQMLGERFVLRAEDERERAAHAAVPQKAGGKRELQAAMPGVVVEVRVAVGDVVEEGQTLVVLEAMKMQNPLSAEAPGRVIKVACKKGDAVAAGALLMELE